MPHQFHPRYRTLGLTVPVTDVLDPDLWRLRYAVGTNAGTRPSRVVTSTNTSCVFGGTLLEAISGEGDQDQAALLGQLVSGLPDSTVRWHLRAALSELEMRLGMSMGIQIVKANPVDAGLVQGVHYDRIRQRLPFYKSELQSWWRVDLPDAGVISIERVRAWYFGTNVWTFDPGTAPGTLVEAEDDRNVIRLEWGTQGVAHLLPVQLSAFLATTGGGEGAARYGLWHTITQHRSAVPDFWGIDYTVGPVSKSGEIGQIESVLADWAYARAGIKLLSMAGLAQSRGLTSASVSMDGVSESVGLQASAIYGLNSALEEVFKRQHESIDWKKLRAYKRGIITLGLGH